MIIHYPKSKTRFDLTGGLNRTKTFPSYHRVNYSLKTEFKVDLIITQLNMLTSDILCFLAKEKRDTMLH